MSESWLKRTRMARILVLLVVLLGVAIWRAVVVAGESASVDWSRPHRVVVCPLIATSAEAEATEARLELVPLALEAWSAAQHETWRRSPGQPFDFVLAPAQRIDERPPRLPAEDDGYFRRLSRVGDFLAFFETQDARFPPVSKGATRLYVYVYPERDSGAWRNRHSVGTRRGRRAFVFASDSEAHWGNAQAVMMHETLHSVGALDHRDLDGAIEHPSGYADPSRDPRYPQEQSEIMALGIPFSPVEEWRVSDLDDVVMGLWTAREIGWIE